MPAAAKVAHDPEVVAALESEAMRRPGAYRARLTLIAVLGDLALTATQVFPLAAPILVGALLLNRELFYWGAGVAILFLAWLFRRTLRIEGRVVTPEEAPRLHGELQALRKKLDAGGRMEVMLTGEFNAGAAESHGLLGLVGTRRVLTLGVPLLAVLSREDLLAIIAHEFGHFSRRHGRLGHWLYRTRAGWLAYVHDVGESDSSFDRAASWYASKFMPFFSVRSFVHSRRCEYEADADAASVVGGGPFATALARTIVFGGLWSEAFRRQAAKWQEDEPEPPRDFYGRFQRFARERGPEELQERLAAALREPSGWQDTHPSLSERLRALNEQPASLSAPADCAGQALFGEHWTGLLREFDEEWEKHERQNWLIGHLRLRHIGPVRGLAELAALHEARPADLGAKFAYAAALLHEGQADGVPIMEAVAREEPAYRARAFACVVGYYERKGDTKQVERWSAWLAKISKALGEALEPVLEQVEQGKARPGPLAGGERALLAEATRRDPCVRDAWLLEGSAAVRYAERRSVLMTWQLLVLRVDLAELQRLGQDEDSVAGRYQELLETLLPADHLPLVRTYFTTEPLPSAYGTYPRL